MVEGRRQCAVANSAAFGDAGLEAPDHAVRAAHLETISSAGGVGAPQGVRSDSSPALAATPALAG